MSDTKNYKAAYERQKKAREHAENALEQVSRELYENHQTLLGAYNSLKEHKAQLLHQEKLASIGQLSAGVAHEINNPTSFVLSNINSIASYIDSFKAYCSQLEEIALDQNKSYSDKKHTIDETRAKLDIEFLSEDVNEAFTDSVEGLTRIQDIVASLKGFARTDATGKETMSVNSCIESTLKLVQSELKYKADLQLELNDLPNIKGRPGEISQVILNLLTNAIDAVDSSGLIKIKTEVGNNCVSISVSDNGDGIEDEQLNKVFDPFFTTKETGKGTGLGLSISHSIIQQHGGTMRVASTKGKGTTFHISLPSD